ncbi:MAG: DNA repair protein RecN [Clostridia bacterium]|nr:DNA repair protein RecN [Clostridia bacterium]
MLTSMHIENIAVIKSLDVDFSRGFSALTGETGAGKSILIDSLNMLLGAKTERELVRTGENSASVSAIFSDISPESAEKLSALGIELDEEGSVFIQRAVTADGKSRSKINGCTYPLSMLREVGALLVNIHGQLDNRDIFDEKAYTDLLDSYAGLYPLREKYREEYRKMTAALSEIERLSSDEREKERKTELLRYQIDDIESAGLKPGEEEELDNEKKVLKNFRQIAKQVSTVYRALYKNDKGMSASRLVDIAHDTLETMTEFVPEAAEYAEKLYEISFEMEHIAENVLAALPREHSDPEKRLDEIETRLDTIHKLKRKYGSTLEQVLEYLDKSKKELDEILLSDDKIKELEKEVVVYRANALKLAKELSEKRSIAAKELSEKISAEIRFLDMEKVKFSVDVSPLYDAKGEASFTKDGTDKIDFLVSTNPGEPPKPLSKIASGGEAARILLSMKCVLTSADKIETLIFDEIDTGVSGKTSQKIGIKLRELGRSMQILCITHSAQVAATAENHFKIKKNTVDGRAETELITLDRNGRIDEISRIMGGVNITDKIRDSAAEMLETAENL